jgi:hypothetical protein
VFKDFSKNLLHDSAHKCPMKRVMPLGLMKYTLKKVFNRLNPGEEVDNINFECLDYPCSFSTAIHDMADQYPQYVWFEQTPFEIENRAKEVEIQNLIDSLIEEGYDEETIDRIVEEREMETVKGGWKVGWVAGRETYTKTVEIKPHLKGKHKRGRIQTTCPPEFIGLDAKVTFVKPEKPKEKPSDWELAEYE